MKFKPLKQTAPQLTSLRLLKCELHTNWFDGYVQKSHRLCVYYTTATWTIAPSVNSQFRNQFFSL